MVILLMSLLIWGSIYTRKKELELQELIHRRKNEKSRGEGTWNRRNQLAQSKTRKHFGW